MRRPHLSTGAWIFASVIAAAIVAPASVYAAATSTVAIGNTHNGTTATVTANHQLLTTTIVPKDIVHAVLGIDCGTVYTPPAGDAVVVTSVTYDIHNNTPGSEDHNYLTTDTCAGDLYDGVDSNQSFETETRTFPTGLPMPSVGVVHGGSGSCEVFITGYLIPASSLPAAAPASKLPARLTHPTH